MKKNLFKISVCAVLCALLSSCFGGLLDPKKDESEFYMLKTVAPVNQPAKAEKSAAAPKANIGKICVNLLPVVLPSYMTGRQLVSVDKNGNIDISEFNRWGERPEDSFSRVIAEDISLVNPEIDVFEYPAVSFADTNIAMRVVVNDCIGEIDGELSFVATWQVSAEPEVKGLTRGGKFRVKISAGNGYAGYVAAMGNAAQKLSVEIEKAIVEIGQKPIKSTPEKK